MNHKSGFVGIIGRPNAGKSTLINALLQEKIAIATYKPQTTRNVIRGILSNENYQIVFMDTPGIHSPKDSLGRQMNRIAYSIMHDVDVILYIVDGTRMPNKADEYIVTSLKNQPDIPVILLVNKLDRVNAEKRFAALEAYNSLMEFAEVLPISALKEKNLDMLLEVLLKYLPEQPAIYPEDMISDYPEDFLISETIREQVLLSLDQEVPYSIAVLIEQTSYKKESIAIQAMIVCERDSQKGIIIGKGGEMLKKISTNARLELEKRFGKRVYLEIYVKVQKDWRNNPERLKELIHSEDE